MSGKVTSLVDWSAHDAIAISRQITERLIEARKAGETVGLAAVMIFDEGDGAPSYEPCYSEMPGSQLLWSASRLEQAAIAQEGEGDE